MPELTHGDMSRCAKDEIDQNREKCCIESITRGDVHQQSKSETCKDRDPGKVMRVLQAEASCSFAPGIAGSVRVHVSQRYLAGQPRAPC